MKKKALVLIGFLAIGSVLTFMFMRNECRGYSCLSFENKNAFRETEKREDNKSSYKGVLLKDGVRIRMEAYTSPTEDTANQFTQAKVMQLEGLFEIARSPYPGAISNEIMCEEKLKPVLKEINKDGIKMTTIMGLLNERLQYGGCVEAQLTYEGRTAMFYCPQQKKWYFFEVITKKNDSQLKKESIDLIESLRCQIPFGI